MLEHRIGNLETDMREVKKDLTEIRVVLARIEAELGHKVSYKWLALYVLGLAAIILRSEIAALFSG